MSERSIVVAGGSAGSVVALQYLVRTLPADLPAAVFVVTHVPAGTTSFLPTIPDRVASLPAVHAENAQAIEHGKIYTAPPDYHLRIEAKERETQTETVKRLLRERRSFGLE